MTGAARALASALLVAHFVGMAASLGKATPWGAAVRSVTATPERALGLWQSWGMFGPNPPSGTSWLVVTGVDADGRQRRLEPLVGVKTADRFELRYLRLGKVERVLFVPADGRAPRHFYARWHCERERAAGRPLAEVVVAKAHHRSRKPRARREGQPPEPATHVELSRVACARADAP